VFSSERGDRGGANGGALKRIIHQSSSSVTLVVTNGEWGQGHSVLKKWNGEGTKTIT